MHAIEEELLLHEEPTESLTEFEGSLGLLSIIVGGGICSIPYATFAGGIGFGLVLLFGCAMFAYAASVLLMKSRDMCPTQVSTLYELTYSTLGRKAIFLVSSLAVIMNTGYTMIYFILFSGNAAALGRRFLPESALASDILFWNVLLGIGLLPVVIKDELHEIKTLSFVLFGCTVIFVIIMGVQLLFLDGADRFNPDEKPYDYPKFVWSLEMISGFSIYLSAFNYSYAELPLYRSLGPTRSNEKLMRAI